MQNKNLIVEVEGQELILRNANSDYVIIPKKYRTEVQGMIKDGCHGCIDKLVETLPTMADYAEDGSLYPEEPIINPNNPIKLPEVTISAEAPTYVKYRQSWEKENPFDINKYVEDRFNNPVGREAIKRIDAKGWREQLKQEGLQKRQQELDEATKMGLLYQRFNPQDKDDISIADEQFKKRYGTSPHRYRYDNDPEYRRYYENVARNATSKIDYPSTDLRRKDVVAPNNMWMYPNLTGESKAQATNFSNEVIGMALPIPGLETMGKIPSIFKAGKNLIKPVSKVVNKVDDASKVGSKVLNKTDDVFKQVDNSISQTSKQWQMQELPGLHLKSTMSDGAVTKIVEPKTGLINVEQALGIIGKESGGADKVALIKQGLGETLPKKMDYNEFRKIVQDQLIPLEKKFTQHSSNYGLERIGYPLITAPEHESLIGRMIFKKNPLIENQTLILGNKGKFGRGSSAHGNPEETLGHIHFLRDAETPDVLTVTQIQSDAFQGTHRIMPKIFNKEAELRNLERMEDIAKRQQAELSKAIKRSDGYWELPDGTLMIDKIYKEGWTMQGQFNAMKKAEIENFTQKHLLDKNHQERYLQELVDYAGKRGDINKVRVPTSETAAKVQGYSAKKTWNIRSLNNGDEVVLLDGTKGKVIDDTFNNCITIETTSGKKINIDFTDAGYGTTKQSPIKSINDVEVKEIGEYTLEHQTILKKYSEQPKTIKKLFGIEPKVVTDSKGNTWYEFDIPKKFKKGKGEIKAFTTTGAIIGTGATIQSQQNNKTEQ